LINRDHGAAKGSWCCKGIMVLQRDHGAAKGNTGTLSNTN